MGHPQQIYDRERLSLNIVRLKKSGKNFEIILSNPDDALELRRGASISVGDVLRSPEIFSNSRQAEAASTNDLKNIFGTEKKEEVAKVIIKDGDFHLTAEQKKQILDAKMNKIIEYIHMNAMDPKTKLPHPKQRIELAMEQARLHINMYESIVSQTDVVVKALQPILPMSFEKLALRITIPAIYTNKAYSVIKSKYAVKREAWQNDGSVLIELDTQAGKKQDIFNLVNNLTKGEAHITEVKI